MDIYWKIEGVYIESRSWDEGTAQDRDTKGLLMLVCLLGPQSLGLGEKGKACPTRTFEANGEEIPGEHFGRAAPSIMFVSVLGQEPPEWSRNSVRANHTWSLSARLTEEYLRIGLPMWFIQQWLVFKPWEPIIRLYICAWVYMGVHPARGSLLRLWAAFPQLNPGTLGWMLGPDGWLRLHNEVVHMPTGDDSTAAQQQPPRSRDILRGAAPISSVGIPNMASMELVRWLESGGGDATTVNMSISNPLMESLWQAHGVNGTQQVDRDLQHRQEMGRKLPLHVAWAARFDRVAQQHTALKVQKVPHGAAWRVMRLLRRCHA